MPYAPGRCPSNRNGSSGPSSTRCSSSPATTPPGTVRHFAGMTSKLDYLRWLGVDCLWLPPFYDSPRRDGGYDIRDYYQISPEHGSIENFVTFVDEAHARGIRVITDLVLNHTSDTHAWFQASRSDPNGPCVHSYPTRDTEPGYAGVRIVLCDTEHSNWTLDPVR